MRFVVHVMRIGEMKIICNMFEYVKAVCSCRLEE